MGAGGDARRRGRAPSFCPVVLLYFPPNNFVPLVQNGCRFLPFFLHPWPVPPLASLTEGLRLPPRGISAAASPPSAPFASVGARVELFGRSVGPFVLGHLLGWTAARRPPPDPPALRPSHWGGGVLPPPLRWRRRSPPPRACMPQRAARPWRCRLAPSRIWASGLPPRGHPRGGRAVSALGGMSACPHQSEPAADAELLERGTRANLFLNRRWVLRPVIVVGRAQRSSSGCGGVAGLRLSLRPPRRLFSTPRGGPGRPLLWAFPLSKSGGRPPYTADGGAMVAGGDPQPSPPLLPSGSPPGFRPPPSQRAWGGSLFGSCRSQRRGRLWPPAWPGPRLPLGCMRHPEAPTNSSSGGTPGGRTTAGEGGPARGKEGMEGAAALIRLTTMRELSSRHGIGASPTQIHLRGHHAASSPSRHGTVSAMGGPRAPGSPAPWASLPPPLVVRAGDPSPVAPCPRSAPSRHSWRREAQGLPWAP